MKNTVAIRKIVLMSGILSSAVAATIYGVTFVGMGIAPYTMYFDRATIDAGRYFKDWGSSPPRRECTPRGFRATKWREGQYLPRRDSSSLDARLNWSNNYSVWEFDLWETAGFDHNELNTYAHDLLARRTMQIWAAPAGIAVPIAIIASGCILGAAVFLLLTAIVRAILLAFQLSRLNARFHILSATAFSASILCWGPKFALVGFVLTNPPIRWALYSPLWEPWSFAQELSDYSLYHVAWAVLLIALCWCGIAAIVSALRFAAIRSPLPRPLCDTTLRLLLWSLPVLLVFWFALSILVTQPITLKLLLPLDFYY